MTLAVDIGGSGMKAMLLDRDGSPLTDRVRIETPRPATPANVLRGIQRLVRGLGDFDRVSVGFPGVVVDGITHTAPNLDRGWKDYPLARTLASKLGRPVRILNDAGLQGYGVIEGRGLEMLLTFGTGMGTALYYDGRYIPNLELAHHPFRGNKTYEDLVGQRALTKLGKKRWNERVAEVVAQVDPIWNPRRIYLSGGNARHLRLKLPEHVRVVDDAVGLRGGIALWRDE